MASLQDVTTIGSADSGLAVVSTSRGDGTMQASVVNAGVVSHPLQGDQVVAFVTYGRTKLAHLRMRPQVTRTFRAGWQWVAVEGQAALIGPDDPHEGFSAADVPVLLREIFTAAGGTHDDWDAYDGTMVEQRRTAVLVRPVRIYSN